MRLTFKLSRQKYFLAILVVLIVGAGGVITKAFFLGGGGAPQSSSDIDLQRGLVGWWKLDGNAKDSTPYASDGTLMNSPTAAADRHGAAASAMSFNGVNQYINIPAAKLPTSAITVSLWVNQSTLASYYDLAINNWTTEGSWDLFTPVNGQLYFGIFSGGAQYNSACNAGAFTAGSWHNIIGTYDGTTVKAYLDGTLCPATKAVSGVTLRNSGNWQLGEHGNGSTHTIDDARIYNRALSVNEISALYNSYNSSLSLDSGQAGLVGWWKLDGNTKDSSPYAHDGTSVGTVAAAADRESSAAGAMSFSGSTTSAITTGYNFPLQNFSVSIWAKPDGTGPSSFSSIISNARDCCSTNSGFQLEYNHSNNIATARLWAGGAGVAKALTTSIAINSWNLFTMTYDSSTFILYKNGVQVASGAYSGSLGTPLYNLSIGKMGYSATNYSFGGLLDDARIYNRALSATEVANLYNSHDSNISLYNSANSGSNVNLSSGLLGEWDFNGNARDATPYGNNGIVSGAALINDRNGRANSAYQLGNTNQWINVGSPTTYQNLPTAFTYSIWLESTGTSTNQWPEVMGASNTHTYFGIRTNNYGGNVYFEYGTSPYSGSTFAGLASYALGSNTWHMYTVTYDGSVLKSYLDGVYKTQATGVALNPSFGGLSFSTSTSGFVGAVDDARVWNRALSQAEVTDVYGLYH